MIQKGRGKSMDKLLERWVLNPELKDYCAPALWECMESMTRGFNQAIFCRAEPLAAQRDMWMRRAMKAERRLAEMANYSALPTSHMGYAAMKLDCASALRGKVSARGIIVRSLLDEARAARIDAQSKGQGVP